MKTKMSKTHYKEGYDFKESDFLRLFMYGLIENGVFEFNANEISGKLFPYKYDEKYEEMFCDITTSMYEQRLNLANSISEIKSIRFVNWLSNDSDRLLIALPHDVYKEYVEKLYSPKYIELMQQLVAEYIFRTEIEKKGRYKLNIYGLDPNRDYSLITGMYRGEGVEERIITDGILAKSYYVNRKPDDMIYTNDPKDRYAGIGLVETKSRSITIANASFVIEQAQLDYGFCKSKLYTKIMDPKMLELLAYYSTISYSPKQDKTLTSEKPYVYSLKNIE